MINGMSELSRHSKPARRQALRLCALTLVLASGAAVADGMLSGFGQKLGLFEKEQSAFLMPDEAFVFSAEARDADTVVVRWRIADGYYLYRSRLAFNLQDDARLSLGEPVMPAGKVKEDEYFGRMEVYYGDLAVTLPIDRSGDGAARRVRIETSYQGCAEAGLCYSPISKSVELELPAV